MNPAPEGCGPECIGEDRETAATDCNLAEVSVIMMCSA